MSAEHVRLHATVSGRVQGVGFRYSAQDVARRLGLTGWVRNRRGGQVEVVAEGRRAVVEEFERFLRQGPTAARVTAVETVWSAASGEYASFGVTG